MSRKTTLPLAAAVAALLMLPRIAIGAGGSPAPSISPMDQAEESYNRGLKHRDIAWEVEAKAESLDGAQLEKAMKKMTKEFEKAVRAFRSAVDDDPSLFAAHSSLGYALRRLGNYEEALVAYDRALELEPQYAEAIEYRAEAYLGLDRLEEAKEAYMELFRSAPEHAAELMAAMENWVEQRAATADSLGSDAEAFAAWVEERAGLVGQATGTGSAGW